MSKYLIHLYSFIFVISINKLVISSNPKNFRTIKNYYIKRNKDEINNFTNLSNSILDSSTRKKNLIIGAFIKYNWKKIEPFFISLKKAGFKNYDCVMYVDCISQKAITLLKSLGVIIKPIADKYKKAHISNYRWKIYEDFLNQNKDKYNLVFTSDIRDTFFQRNIFDYFNNYSSFLGIVIEDGNLSEGSNRNWLNRGYGEEIFNIIKNESIICSGTVWGTVDIFREFSRKMWEQLKSKELMNIGGMDQGVANYLIYYKKEFNNYLVKSQSKDGLIITIGLTKIEKIHVDLENNIINEKGQIVAIIHQYNRKPKIKEHVLNKYRLQNNLANLLPNAIICKHKLEFNLLVFTNFLLLFTTFKLIKYYIHFHKKKDKKISKK